MMKQGLVPTWTDAWPTEGPRATLGTKERLSAWGLEASMPVLASFEVILDGRDLT